MRPYLAILKDSLREAVYSRILWVLFALIVVVLLAIAPFTIVYPLTTRITARDFADIRDLSIELYESRQLPEEDARRSLWDQLDRPLQIRVAAMAQREYAIANPDAESLDEALTRATLDESNGKRNGRALATALASALHQIVESDGAFTEYQLQQVQLLGEPETLRLRKDPEARTRMNRLAVQQAFPDAFVSRSGRSAQLMYFVWPLGGQIPLGRNEIENVIEFVLAQFMNFVVGFVGVFTGVLVTASIIPSTFHAGSINLLLSKPISRPFLYLTKVLGGCWFVLLNGVLVVLGVYLIAGWRFGVWAPRLIACIPVFLFLFLIYYSISAFAGLVWRNTVIAIVMAVLCWLACTIVEATYHLIRNLQLEPHKLTSVEVGDHLVFSKTESGSVQQWDKDASMWLPVFASDAPGLVPGLAQSESLIGPVYMGSAKKLFAVRPSWSSGTLLAASEENNWKRQSLGKAPRDTRYLLVQEGKQLYSVHRKGISRLRDDGKSHQDNRLGSRLRSFTNSGLFTSVGPKKFHFSDRGSAAIHPTESVIYIADEGKVQRLSLQEQRFELTHAFDFGDEKTSYLIAAGGDCLCVGTNDGVVAILEESTLVLRHQMKPFGKVAVKRVAVSEDGLWAAVLFHDGCTTLYDARTGQRAASKIPARGEISTFQFVGNEIMVIDHFDSVRFWNPSNDEVRPVAEPRPTLLVRFYRHIVAPLYWIFPKPGRLSETTTFLLTESKSEPSPGNSSQSDLRVSRPTLNPWAPAISSGVFTLVALFAGCIYISRAEI